MSITRVGALLLVSVFLSSGCTSPARVVHRDLTNNTGVVAIPENTNVWPFYHRDAAIKLIMQHGSSFEITSEGEEKVGEVVTNHTNTNREGTPDPLKLFENKERISNTSTTTVSDRTEYRIHYRIKPVTGTLPVQPGNQLTNNPVAKKPAGNVSNNLVNQPSKTTTNTPGTNTGLPQANANTQPIQQAGGVIRQGNTVTVQPQNFQFPANPSTGTQGNSIQPSNANRIDPFLDSPKQPPLMNSDLPLR